jgi:putative transcriptional regulator
MPPKKPVLKSQLAKDLNGALKEVLAHRQGKLKLPGRTYAVAAQPDVKAVRAELGMTQAAFAQQFGFSVSAVRNWEQGLRTPEAPIRAYLAVIHKAPATVLAALDLNTLLNEITPENRHPAVDAGVPMGREA